MSAVGDSTWREMQRLRDLGTELGKDPLQLAVEELALISTESPCPGVVLRGEGWPEARLRGRTQPRARR